MVGGHGHTTRYKKRMAKRNKNLVRGPQGSVPTAEDAFRNKGPSTAQTAVRRVANEAVQA